MRSPTPRARGRLLAVPWLFAACAALSGCCGATGGTGLTIGADAPDFQLTTIHGSDAVDLSDYEGRVVLVNFWASWCGPCLLEVPELETLFDRYEEDGLMIIGVSTDTTAAEARGFLDQSPVSYPMVWDERGDVANTYKVLSLPRNVLIDRQGRVRSRHDGYDSRDFQTLKSEIADLLEESP